MNDTTVTEGKVADFMIQPGGSRFAHLFTILKDMGLGALGKSNTGTLLFQATANDGTVDDVLAFRFEPSSLLSFPKSYWLSRKELRASLCTPFTIGEQPGIKAGVGSFSNESAWQVAINRDTFERVSELCVIVCEGLIETHNVSVSN